jgi:transposase
MAVVGDRGMITAARIRDDLKPAGLDWITCLRAPAIQALAAENRPLQLSLFDERDLAEITAPEMFPGERLIVCRNRELAAERARKREELLASTERALTRIEAQVRRKGSRLKGAAEIGVAVGAVIDKNKMAKHFAVEIRDGHLSFKRRTEEIEEEARLDGIYVIRTSLPFAHLDTNEAVQAYKDLARVERAFRSLKTIDLDIRPIRHWTPKRVRAHVFLCMLAYYVEWHMRQNLAPVLFDDEQPGQRNGSAVSPARRSASALTKAREKRTSDNAPVQSFRDWLKDLATIARNRIQPKLKSIPEFEIITRPTAAQQRALTLLGITL